MLYYCLGSWQALTRMRKRLGCLMLSLPQALIKRLIILGYPAPRRKIERRKEVPLTQGEMVLEQLHQLSTYKSFGPDGILPKGTERGGSSAHWAPFHHFPTALDKQEGPCYWRLANVRPSYKKGCKETPGLSACLMSRPGKVKTTRAPGPATWGLWKAGSA